MNIFKSYFAVAAILLGASCGDNLKSADANSTIDAPEVPPYCSGCPDAPALNMTMQIDRMGRPAVNTALNHAFDGSTSNGLAGGTPNANAPKDAYNADADPTHWSTYAASFATSLAILDYLDSGLTCTDGTCAANTSNECKNQVLYNGQPGGGGNPAATSYSTLAGILTDDQLYLDTTKPIADLPSHANYLAVELNVVAGVENTTGGGRAPTNDVIDTSFTALAIGIQGFKASDGSFAPAFGDGVDPHDDENNVSFPFLGEPH
jgi:hypothetical protein